AVFGPPNISKRIVGSLFFIHRIVASWTVRGGDQNVEFLDVDIGARHIEPDIPDDDDPRLLSAGAKCLGEDIARGGCGRNDDGVSAMPVGQLDDALDEIPLSGVDADI